MATTNRRTTRGRSGRTHEHNGQQLKEQVATVGRDVRDLAATAGALARERVDPIEGYVREQPLQSLMIAAGVGALLSFVLLRR